LQENSALLIIYSYFLSGHFIRKDDPRNVK